MFRSRLGGSPAIKGCKLTKPELHVNTPMLRLRPFKALLCEPCEPACILPKLGVFIVDILQQGGQNLLELVVR